MYISINGELIKERLFHISPLSEGLRYGYGLFETLKIFNHKLHYFEEHWERMRNGCNVLNLSLNRVAEEVESDCHKLAQANNTASGAVRILYFKNCDRNDLLITTEPVRYAPDAYDRGFKLCIADTIRTSNSPMRKVKTNNFLENILARENAKKRGYDEALFVNSFDQVCEGTVSNVFFVIDGEIYTPAIDCGILPGILRDKVLEIIRELGLSVHVGTHPASLLDASEEIFITNSILGIMPVSRLNNKTLDLTRNRQTKRLMSELQQRELALT